MIESSSTPALGRPYPVRVFVADDDREMRRMIAQALRHDEHFVLEAADGAALMADLGHAFHGAAAPDGGSVVISDVRMPGRDGLAILRALNAHAWRPPVILTTAFGDPALHAEAQVLGAHAVFDKPFDLSVLRATVRALARGSRGGSGSSPWFAPAAAGSPLSAR